MTQAARFLVLGEPASKANSRRIVTNGAVRRSIKSAKALDYAKTFLRQIRPLASLLTGDLVVTIAIYYASRRPDLDESLILDLLQGVAYANDRQVKERHVYWGLDKANPRSEIYVEQVAGVETGTDPGSKRRSKSKRATPS